MPALWQHAARLIAVRDIGDRLRQALSADPDHALVRARGASEQLVASVRLGIIVLVVALMLVSARSLFSLMVSGIALIYGFALFVLPRKISAPWLPWVVSTIDVSLASLVIGSLAFFGMPLPALNNRVMFDWYFVAITLAALRFDWRLCAFTTLMALGQIGAITLYVASHWDLATLSSATHGTFVPVQHMGRLVMLTAHGAGTIAIAQWARHLRLLIGTDQLTGLLQRRPFFERIDEELERADVGRTQLSIAIFDVDQFKQFNDRFGHLEGDRALQMIGEQLKKAVRTTDLVARYGGEEFVIAFPRMDVQLAMRRADILRAEIESVAIGKDGAVLTVSGGVASWPADGHNFEEVLRRADERLYGAKAAGRNIVIGPRPVPIRTGGETGV